MKISTKWKAFAAVAALVTTIFAGASATNAAPKPGSSSAPKPAGNSVVWSGQGSTVIEGTRVVTNSRCDANNSAYLLFVLSGTKASSARISLDGGQSMTKTNTDKRGYSTFKYNFASNDAIDLAAMLLNVTAYYVDAQNKPSFVVSHGCMGGSVGTTNYTINASAGANGAITPSGAVSVAQGADQTFAITADTGFEIDTLTVDGSPVTPSSSYTFSAVAANHSISVTFKTQVVTHTITASAGANGSISPSGATSVVDGANQTFTFTPDSGYAVSSLIVDGTSVPVANSYTFSNVTADHTISVSFAAPSFMLYASAGWDEGNPNYAYSATCDGVNSPNGSYSYGCSKVQIVVNYDNTGSSRPGGYPLVSGRERWQYLYASSGLSCTETQQLTTLPYSSTFDCDVTGATTYFIAMGVATSAPNQTYWPVGTAYVLGHNYVSFGSITGSYTGTTLDSWSPGTNSGPGYQACLVENNVATSTCFTVTNGEFWMNASDAAYMHNAYNTWELTLAATAVAGDQYSFWDWFAGGSKVGPLTFGNSVRITTHDNTIVFSLYENLS